MTKKKLTAKQQKFIEWTSVYAMVKFGGFSRQIVADMNNVSRQTIDGIIRKVENAATT